MPKVSAIIPLYNGERFIRDAIESVLCQTFQDFELIVVDDGSTDQGKDVVLSNGGPVTYLHQENSGVCTARNRGFVNSRGQYIAFLDQDDVWYPRKLEIQLGLLERNLDLDVVYSDMDLIDASGNIIEHNFLRNSGARGAAIFSTVIPDFPNPFPYPSAVMMRKEIFTRCGMYDASFKKNNSEDIELWARITKLGGRFYFYPESLCQYRSHPLQGGRDSEAWLENWGLLLKKLKELYQGDIKIENKLNQLTQQMLWMRARVYSREGKELIRKGKIRQGRMYLKRSFDYYPFYWKNLSRLVRSYLGLV